MGTGGPFPGDIARPGRDADHSPPSSAEAKNDELHTSSSPCRLQEGSGTTLLLLVARPLLTPVAQKLCSVTMMYSRAFYNSDPRYQSFAAVRESFSNAHSDKEVPIYSEGF
jgi:hypothetical protein